MALTSSILKKYLKFELMNSSSTQNIFNIIRELFLLYMEILLQFLIIQESVCILLLIV